MSADDSSQSTWILDALDRFERPLLRYAAGFCRDTEQARDVVQDTFLKLCGEDRSRLDGRLAEWLFTVCRNRALDLYRKDKRMTPLTECDLDRRQSDEPHPADRLEKLESTGAALRAMRDLPENQREVLRLKFQHDLSYKEISGITGLSVSNVGFLLHTGLKTLRGRLNSPKGDQ